jgi:hypothetical protein
VVAKSRWLWIGGVATFALGALIVESRADGGVEAAELALRRGIAASAMNVPGSDVELELSAGVEPEVLQRPFTTSFLDGFMYDTSNPWRALTRFDVRLAGLLLRRDDLRRRDPPQGRRYLDRLAPTVQGFRMRRAQKTTLSPVVLIYRRLTGVSN